MISADARQRSLGTAIFANLRRWLVAAATVSTAALTACGGGGGGGGAPPPPPTSTAPPTVAPTRNEAARFLTQASFGPAPADVDRVVALGYSAWLDEQFNSQASLHLPAVPPFGPTITPQFVGQFPLLSSFWTKAAIAPDQLRQRAMYSLSQLFVISMVDNNVMSYPQGIATYMDLLGRDAFGNFRQLLEDVTLSPMMGLYLSHLGNQKEDPATGRVPDENYAREVMQLFTIGLVELNHDGTVKL